MKLILFSNPNNDVLERLEREIFPKNRHTVFGYMPADGNDPGPRYTLFWQNLASKHDAEFIYVDNSREPTLQEFHEFDRVNSLMITGGNVFALLANLRKSKLDKLIIEKTKYADFIYSGFSAGAIVASPNIRIASKEYGWSFGGDENLAGLKDTKALGLVDYEILPHFNKQSDSEKVERYANRYQVKVVSLTDSDFTISAN